MLLRFCCFRVCPQDALAAAANAMGVQVADLDFGVLVYFEGTNVGIENEFEGVGCEFCLSSSCFVFSAPPVGSSAGGSRVVFLLVFFFIWGSRVTTFNGQNPKYTVKYVENAGKFLQRCGWQLRSRRLRHPPHVSLCPSALSTRLCYCTCVYTCLCAKRLIPKITSNKRNTEYQTALF